MSAPIEPGNLREKIAHLRDEKNLTFRKIGETLGLSLAQARNHYLGTHLTLIKQREDEQRERARLDFQYSEYLAKLKDREKLRNARVYPPTE